MTKPDKKKKKTKLNKMLVGFFVNKFIKGFAKKSDDFLDDEARKRVEKERHNLIYNFLKEKNIKNRNDKDCKTFAKIIGVPLLFS